MNQADLITSLANEADVNKTSTESVIKALGGVVQAALAAGEDITLPGIGKFSVTAKPAREGRNPRTGETVQIAAKNAPKFTAAKALKDALNT